MSSNNEPQPRYNTLRAELAKLVGSDVGFYQVTVNKTIQAIKVVPPEPKSSWKPHGIELIIQRTPRVISQRGMYHSGVQRQEEWTLILTQYDRDELNLLTQMVNLIMVKYPLSSSTHQPQTEQKLERANIYLLFNRYLRM